MAGLGRVVSHNLARQRRERLSGLAVPPVGVVSCKLQGTDETAFRVHVCRCGQTGLLFRANRLCVMLRRDSQYTARKRGWRLCSIERYRCARVAPSGCDLFQCAFTHHASDDIATTNLSVSVSGSRG